MRKCVLFLSFVCMVVFLGCSSPKEKMYSSISGEVVFNIFGVGRVPMRGITKRKWSCTYNQSGVRRGCDLRIMPPEIAVTVENYTASCRISNEACAKRMECENASGCHLGAKTYANVDGVYRIDDLLPGVYHVKATRERKIFTGSCQQVATKFFKEKVRVYDVRAYKPVESDITISFEVDVENVHLGLRCH